MDINLLLKRLLCPLQSAVCFFADSELRLPSSYSRQHASGFYLFLKSYFSVETIQGDKIGTAIEQFFKSEFRNSTH